LNIKFYEKQYSLVNNPDIYVGEFEYQDGETKESVTIICEDNTLYCSPSWFTHIKMIAVSEHEFELLAFPMVFKYSFLNGFVNLTVSGNYNWGIVGKTLKRIK
jgi:hypothetical protein